MNNFYRMLRYGMVLTVICVIASTTVNAQESFNMEKRGLPVEGVILTAILQQNAVAPGDPVVLNLHVQNTSTGIKSFVLYGITSEYILTIEDEQRHLLTRVSKEYDGYARTVHDILPGDELLASYPVTETCDLKVIRNYRITASRKIYNPGQEKFYDVVSNTVILTVSDHLAKDITLTSALAKPIVEIDTPIALSLTLKNTSNTPKTLTAKDLTDCYTLTVQDFRGEIMLPINKEKAGVDEKVVDRVLQPDETIVANIDIAKQYDLHKEGRYFITASHNVTDDKGQLTQVYSNTVILTVSKTPPPEVGYHAPPAK